MNDRIEIHGAAELQRALEALPAKIERNVLRGALRAGAVEILREAKALTPAASGDLRASVRLSSRVKGGDVTVSVIAGGRKKGDPFYAHFVEYGTKPHDIRPKNRHFLGLGGAFRKEVRHPGAQARPFMRPAFEARNASAVQRIADYIRERLARLAKAAE